MSSGNASVRKLRIIGLKKRRKGMIMQKPSEPRVGIFWLYKRHLIVDETSLSDAERYGDVSGRPTSHIDHWTELQRNKSVLPELEYDEFPRGRVVYDNAAQQFILRADACILRSSKLVRQIVRKLHLPPNTKTERDDHYRCSVCLRRNAERDERE
jgi:hypothetical protein